MLGAASSLQPKRLVIYACALKLVFMICPAFVPTLASISVLVYGFAWLLLESQVANQINTHETSCRLR